MKEAEEPDIAAALRERGEAVLKELIGDPSAPTRPGPKRSVVAERIGDIPAKSLPTLWRDALPELRTAYDQRCAYLAMRIHATGLATVDHFKPKSKHQHLAYEWSNFRLASHQVNTNKGEHEDVLDPFQIEEGWFVLDIGRFEVVPGAGLVDPGRARVVETIERLKLNEPTFCAARAEFHDRYLGLRSRDETVPPDPLPFSWLESECPFVALELLRQERVRSGDADLRR